MIAVVIATRNRPAYLVQCLDSVAAQDLKPSSVIVVDDGSDVDLGDIQRLYQGRLPLKWIRQPQKGVCAARNWAALITSEPWTCVMDDDDVMPPGRLRAHMSHVEREPVDVSYGGWINFEEGTSTSFFPGKPFSETAFVLEGGLLVHGGSAVRTELLKANPYAETLAAGGDFEMFSRLVRKGAKFGHCGSYVLLRRLHSERLGAVSATRDLQRGTRKSVVEKIEAEWRARNDVRERPRTPNVAGLPLDLGPVLEAAGLPNAMFTVFQLDRKLANLQELRRILERWPLEGAIRSDRPSSAAVEVVLDTRALAAGDLARLIQAATQFSARTGIRTESPGPFIESLRVVGAKSSTTHAFDSLAGLLRLHDDNPDAVEFRLVG